jgi:hypothetical protein
MPSSTVHVLAWIAEPPAVDDDAWLVWDAIVNRGLVRDVEIAAAVAEGLFRRDFAVAGPSSDVGIFQGFYRGEAWRLLHQLEGTRVREAAAWAR